MNAGDGTKCIGLQQPGAVSSAGLSIQQTSGFTVGPDLVAEDFNDDSLGRSLDELYAKGVTEVFARVAARALRVYRIEHRFVHVDSNSFHLHGQYEIEEPNREAITITEV